ncbi:hypothetical protein [Bradyrhizobium sp. STM 3809]|uniref:hypothetical protein n=1 Tax=Bradyrhizobium sp. STM 3809 TaxID=551936 RepID=UPI0002409251|nr:hypothetical protein [Bradyrhizobium sp. STM 3809]CCE00647.1 conserved exported hypothetical protein [Bradyrhizobium sp. STM 3809]
MQTSKLRHLRRVFDIVAFSVAALLTIMARPACADGERVIAVPELRALTPEAKEDATRLPIALRARFQALPSLRVVEEPVPMASPDRPDILLPAFGQLRDRRLDIVLVGNATVLSDGRHKVTLWIWNVEKQTQLLGQQYVFGAHPGHEQEIADLVGERLLDALKD